MKDPYEVLGVPRTATEDEIKSAYRKLAKQYHPDLHPGDKSCEEKMNEINAAYEQIKNPQPQQQYGGYSSGGYSSGGYSSGSYDSGGGSYGGGNGYSDPFGFGFDFDPFGFGYQQAGYRSSTQYETRDSTEVQSALHFVNAGEYESALNVLDSVAAADRDDRWYYASARAHYGMGDTVTARDHIQRALNMEPDNADYQRFEQIISSGGRMYTNAGNGFGFSAGNMNWCRTAIGLWCLCNVCLGGRGGIYCC